MTSTSFLGRLYRGETRINFIGNRMRWYAASGLLILICVLSFIFRGFNEGVEFKGGSTFQIPVAGTSITADDANTAFTDAGVPPGEAPQVVGSGSSKQIVVNTPGQTPAQEQKLVQSVARSLGIGVNSISPNTFSSRWGHDTTVKALQGLVIFLIVVSIYISLRFQWRMAVGGMLALLHDLLVAAGVYSLVGFEVTPSTIVGLLTILGFSLYDTVVVYDKVAENAKDILAGSRTTYSEAANLAVNQTLMRSINTSLIALLPVGGLLFVGAGLLGVGTIKDLALILFVGLASGAYSSLFLATPIVVDLTEREPQYKALTKRVVAKRASEARRAEEAALTGATVAPRRTSGPAPAPKVGARPERRKRK
jgi:preprotein translocase subunit SecF